jgi:hypothetical protein
MQIRPMQNIISIKWNMQMVSAVAVTQCLLFYSNQWLKQQLQPSTAPDSERTCRDAPCVPHDAVHLSTRKCVSARTDPLSSLAVGQCMKVDTSHHLRVRLAAHLPLRDVMASPANGIRCSTTVINGEARVMHCGDLGGVVTYTRCIGPASCGRTVLVRIADRRTMQHRYVTRQHQLR